MLTAETSEMIERTVILVLPRPRQNGEAVSKTYEPFICGDMHYVSNLLCKRAEVAEHWPRSWIAFLE